MTSRVLGLLFAAVVIASTAPARAQVDLTSSEALSGLIDLRVAASEGETSWLDRGYGKTRYSGAGDDWRITPEIAQASLVWKPRLTWNVTGAVTLQARPGQDEPVDVVEGYINWKPTPRSALRYSARAGLYFPHVSMEHNDVAWGTTYTITPSAINAWVGEEVKVVGAEGSLAYRFGQQELSATAGLVGYNDTSGTLLALRGWALHDVMSSAYSNFPLPRLDPPFERIWRNQAVDTDPTREFDDRIGWYARAEWRTGGPFAVNAFYYDNGGDPTRVEVGQWGWDTRFLNLGASLDVDENTRFLSQVMWGETIEGMPTPQGYWIDVGYSSVYFLGTRRFGPASLTGRLEFFETRDRTWVARDDNNERGWAATAAVRYDVSPRTSLLFELLHVESDRFARSYQGVAARQDQTTAQAALRLYF